MRYHDQRRRSSTNTALPPYFGYVSAEFHFIDDASPRLARRTVKIAERREVEVIERKPGTDSATFFSIPPKPAETTRKWSSERTAEIEETFE